MDLKIGDGVAVGTLGATALGWLPHIATALTIVWFVIRIYETKTVQGWIKKLKR